MLNCSSCGKTWVERLRTGERPELCKECRERRVDRGGLVRQRMALVTGPRPGDLPTWYELLNARGGDPVGRDDPNEAFAAALLDLMDQQPEPAPAASSPPLRVCNCRACGAVFAGPGPYELCHRCILARERGPVAGGAHGLGWGVRTGCRCENCVEGLAAGLEMVNRRCQGEPLRSIGEDFHLTRERVRQITVKVAPWQPWEAVRRTHEIELDEVRRLKDLVLAELSSRPCDVCGQPMNDPNPARRFCTSECRKVWERLAYHTDPLRRAQAKRAQARYIIDNAERLPETQVRFAERILSGEVGTDRDFRWMVEGTTAFETAVEAVLKAWPIADQLPASIRRQIYEHLGWEWDGDPDVPSGSDSLRDADWIGGPATGGTSHYADVLTKEFLEEAYLEAGFSGGEIAELVGCAVATVYSALQRFRIPRRGGISSSAGLGETLTLEFLEAEYVDGGRSAPSIAEEVGCDPSTVYAALRRYGIATRGASNAQTWRDTAELLDRSYLEDQHTEQARTPAEIASALGVPRRHVLDALTHHGLLVEDAALRDYRTVLTKEFMTQAYLEKGLSGNAIAEQVGCHPTTVYEALRRHDIRATGQGGKRTRWESVLTKGYLLDSYVERGLSGGQIAEDVGCTPSIVYAWLERHGIQRREARETRSRSGAADWDPAWLREQYLGKGRSGADIADELGVPAPTLYTALRRFGIRRE